MRRLTKDEQHRLREFLKDEDPHQLSEEYAGVCTCCGIVSGVEPDTCTTHHQFTAGDAENCAGIVFGIEQLQIEYPELLPDLPDDREPSFTELIGQAILGNDAERETAERRAGITAAVIRMITCDCGNILDQRTSALVTVQGLATGATRSSVVCHKCHPKIEATAQQAHEAKPGLFRTRIETWDDCKTIE